jgi:hypothetical protein
MDDEEESRQPPTESQLNLIFPFVMSGEEGGASTPEMKYPPNPKPLRRMERLGGTSNSGDDYRQEK